MTPKTLRKERREKFEMIIESSELFAMAEEDQFMTKAERREAVKKLAEVLADAVESRSEVRGVEWAMLSDRKVEKTDFPQALETEALQAFESAFHCPGSWKWYPGKSSDEEAWKSLREAVVKIYQSDGAAGFEGYVTWSAQPYSRGAMTLLAIKNNPENFALSWVAYQGSGAAKKTDERHPEYKPFVPEDKNYVPRPENIKKPIIGNISE